MENIRIEEITEVSQKNVELVNSLLAQLTSSAPNFTESALLQLVESASSRLFFIYYNNDVAGMLTMGTYYSPTGPKTWVEDVVVDQRFRGCSLGCRLMEFAISEAEKVSGNVLMLTSKPARIAANALYRSVGFQPKETNVYRMSFED